MSPIVRSVLLTMSAGVLATVLTGCVPAADAATPDAAPDRPATAPSAKPGGGGFYMYCTPINRTPGYYCTPVDGERPAPVPGPLQPTAAPPTTTPTPPRPTIEPPRPTTTRPAPTVPPPAPPGVVEEGISDPDPTVGPAQAEPAPAP